MVYRDTRQSLIDMNTMFELQQAKTKVPELPAAKPLLVHSGEIRFENVSFSYSEKKEVNPIASRVIVRDLNFTIPAGSSVYR